MSPSTLLHRGECPIVAAGQVASPETDRKAAAMSMI
jgi:hypothetical protein